MSFELMRFRCHPASMPRNNDNNQPVIAIYLATDRDAIELRRLAVLDSAPAAPQGRVLLGVVDGEVHAAIGIDDGVVVADPFRHTADLLDLLKLRVQRIRGGDESVSSIPSRLLGALRRGARGDRPGLPAQAAAAYRVN